MQVDIRRPKRAPLDYEVTITTTVNELLHIALLSDMKEEGDLFPTGTGRLCAKLEEALSDLGYPDPDEWKTAYNKEISGQ